MVNFALPLEATAPVDPDRHLAEQVLEGNPTAFSELVERHWSRIFSRVYALLNNREDAEEVTQDAFARAYQGLSTFRWEASFGTWLYRIASNLARNRYWYWKRRARDRSLSMHTPIGEEGDLFLHDLLPDPESNPADRVRWTEFQNHIERHLDELPEQHREIMEMRLIDHLSYEQIGETLDIPLGTVKSRIARARRHLTRSLGLKDDSNVQAFALELGR